MKLGKLANDNAKNTQKKTRKRKGKRKGKGKEKKNTNKNYLLQTAVFLYYIALYFLVMTPHNFTMGAFRECMIPPMSVAGPATGEIVWFERINKGALGSLW